MRTRMLSLYSLGLLATSFPLVDVAAQSVGQSIPQVVTVGRGEVELKPDRARIEFGVETRAATASAAVAENSRRQRAVLDTLHLLGVAAEQLQTANLQVTPDMVYPGQGQPPRVAGYVARNSIRTEVLKLEQAGTLVDAAIVRGATAVMGLQFYSSKSAEARREALGRAVMAARLDAEAMARAAGYELGTLLEISSGSSSDGPVMFSMAAPAPRLSGAVAEPTPIVSGELRISETVTVRWAIKQ